MLPRPHWLQFSLRSAFLLMAAGCIWLGWRVERERRLKEAIAAIEAMGGTWGSGTMRDPNDWHRVVWVAFDQAKSAERITLTDDGLRHLACLHPLWLMINGVPITDAGLSRLACMDGLRLLELNDTHVTAAGVAELRKAIPNCDIDSYPPLNERPAQPSQIRRLPGTTR